MRIIAFLLLFVLCTRGRAQSPVDSQRLSPEYYLARGNEAFEAGQPGQAILAYERGLRLQPGNDRLKNNLKFVREEAGLTTPVPPDYWLLRAWRWTGAALGTRTAYYLALLLWWLAVAGATLWLLRRRNMNEKQRFVLLPLAVGMALLAVLCYTLGQSRYDYLHREDEAILTAPEATLRVSPSPQGSVEAELTEGRRLELTDRAGDYVKVRLVDGRQGYLPMAALEII